MYLTMRLDVRRATRQNQGWAQPRWWGAMICSGSCVGEHRQKGQLISELSNREDLSRTALTIRNLFFRARLFANYPNKFSDFVCEYNFLLYFKPLKIIKVFLKLSAHREVNSSSLQQELSFLFF